MLAWLYSGQVVPPTQDFVHQEPIPRPWATASNKCDSFYLPLHPGGTHCFLFHRQGLWKGCWGGRHFSVPACGFLTLWGKERVGKACICLPRKCYSNSAVLFGQFLLGAHRIQLLSEMHVYSIINEYLEYKKMSLLFFFQSYMIRLYKNWMTVWHLLLFGSL